MSLLHCQSVTPRVNWWTLTHDATHIFCGADTALPKFVRPGDEYRLSTDSRERQSFGKLWLEGQPASRYCDPHVNFITIKAVACGYIFFGCFIMFHPFSRMVHWCFAAVVWCCMGREKPCCSWPPQFSFVQVASPQQKTLSSQRGILQRFFRTFEDFWSKHVSLIFALRFPTWPRILVWSRLAAKKGELINSSPHGYFQDLNRNMLFDGMICQFDNYVWYIHILYIVYIGIIYYEMWCSHGLKPPTSHFLGAPVPHFCSASWFRHQTARLQLSRVWKPTVLVISKPFWRGSWPGWVIWALVFVQHGEFHPF